VKSSAHPFEQARPHTPGQYDERINVVALEHEQIIFAEPAFELHEAAAVPARLAFGNKRRCFTAECIDVDVVTAATKPARTRERIALGMNTDSAVRLDDLAFNPVALPAMARTASWPRPNLRQRIPSARQIHHVGKRPVRTFQPVHARECRIGHDGDIGGHRRRISASCPR
jgi:hypothetical protein